MITVADAIAHIPSRAVVYISGGAGYPVALVEELLRQAGRFEQLTVLHELLGNPCPFLEPQYGERIKVLALLCSGRTHGAYGRGVLDYAPCHYSEVGDLFRHGHLPAPDFALIQVSPERSDQGWNAGLWVGLVPDAAAASRTVIAEVNAAMPAIPCGAGATVERVDLRCEVEHPLVELQLATPKPEEVAIARNVAELVRDGDTIQIGIGSLAGAIASALSDRKDLGMHSGLISDGMADLLRKEVITNRRKPVDAGWNISAVALGSSDLYRFIAGRRDVRLHPYRHTHAAATIGRLPGFVAINSAVEVDLTGQVNAEWLKGGPIGGVGGQLDFMRGSRCSSGGRSIIALPSTAGTGISRIVAQFQPGTPVSSPRVDVDYVVTEYGIASLRGKGLHQRAAELLAVAHPALRSDLVGACTYTRFGRSTDYADQG